MQPDAAVRLVREHGIAGAGRYLGVAIETFRAAVGWLGVRDEVVRMSWEHGRDWRAPGLQWASLLRDQAELAAADHMKSVGQIAAEVGVARSVVTKALRRQGIPTRPGPRRDGGSPDRRQAAD